MQTKSILIVLIFLFGITILSHSQTQPPNSGMEDWGVTDTIPPINPAEPIGWTTSNFLMNFGAEQTVHQTEDAVGGSFAARLVTVSATVNPPFGSGELDTLGGFLALGVVNQINTGGMDYSMRPDSMSIWVKGTVMPSDTSTIISNLSVYNEITFEDEIIGTAKILITSSIDNYIKLTIAYEYSSDQIPDKLTFRIGVGGGLGSDFNPGNELYVDNIEIIGENIVGIEEFSKTTNNILISPNPFSAQTTIRFENQNNENLSFKLINSYGQVVKEINNINGVSLELKKGNIPSGLYFFTLSNQSKTLYSSKIIIK